VQGEPAPVMATEVGVPVVSALIGQLRPPGWYMKPLLSG
jgi:hypothetical protein